MKFKKQLVVLSFLLIPFFTFSQAQKGYTTSVGVKGGKFSSGFTGKLFFGATNRHALEVNLTVKKNFGTFMSTTFYEHQRPFFYSLLRVPLDYIWGVGAHVAYYRPGYYKLKDSDRIKDTYNSSGISAGIDFKLGLEHPFSFAPVTLSIEACPMIDLVNRGPEVIELAIAARYTMGAVSRNPFKRR